jgi:hypothetical protein
MGRFDDLFDYAEAHARTEDPGTAQEAAAHMITTGQASKLEAEVLAVIKPGGRWTALEIAEVLGRHPWSISPRLAPLKRKGHIIEDGRKPVVNSSGRIRECQAWKARTRQEPKDPT